MKFLFQFLPSCFKLNQIQQAIMEVNGEPKVTKLENINITIPDNTNAQKKEKTEENHRANRQNSDKNAEIYNDSKNMKVSPNPDKENKEEKPDLEFFKENEEKIVYIQSGFRGYKARKDITKTENNEKKDEEKQSQHESKKEEKNSNNVSNCENPQNANNSKYFEDKEAAEFGKNLAKNHSANYLPDKSKDKTEDNGKREKLPVYTFKSGATYEGEWMNGVRDGAGMHIWPDGAKYEGTF